MHILVVSGFLGAGKTTFIQTLSEKTGKNLWKTNTARRE
ncbi:GTP-binding protein [Treponema vincentii]|nr:GTP-binding protein [Treponema vincentii]UTC49066.1 GTP-binding protein [Treponema vincentii]